MRPRLNSAVFNLPVQQIKNGHYSAQYFNRAAEITKGHEDRVMMQVFQRHDATLCGVDEALAILALCSDDPSDLSVSALYDGARVEPWEPVLVISGRYSGFARLESLYLGALARGTKVATNTKAAVEAANGKPVLFFADRFDLWSNQAADGYAAYIGGASGFATPAMCERIPQEASGTMPHALIACHGGSVVEAARAFAKTYPEVPVIPLVDFNNDCVMDSLHCLKALGENLAGVRLDTSGDMVDKSIAYALSSGKLEKVPGGATGVIPELVWNVRQALDSFGGQHVKIYASGGFVPDRIRAFEEAGVPVDGYGVGSSLLRGGIDFTADIVAPKVKAGRKLRFNPSLEPVDLNGLIAQ